MNSRLLALLPLLSLLIGSAAQAVLVEIPALQDTSIFQDNPDNGNGAGQFIVAGVTGPRNGVNLRRGIISFDIAGSVPAGSEIVSATLLLTVAKVPDESTLGTTQSLFLATSDWGEGPASGTGVGAPAQAGDATWNNNFFNTSSWITAGGDFNPTASATSTVFPVTNQTIAWASTQMALDVQSWLNAPANNYGWFIIGNEAGEHNARGYYSSDNLNTALQPRLLINYNAVPEPSTYWLMLFGGCGLIFFAKLRRVR